MTDIEIAAAKRADMNVDCTCDPTHPFHGDRCWYHMSETEKYIDAFVSGATWQQIEDDEIREKAAKYDQLCK
jgi:hypothetical protein